MILALSILVVLSLSILFFVGVLLLWQALANEGILPPIRKRWWERWRKP